MKALVYHGQRHYDWEDVAAPTIQEPTDAVVRVDATTICGTDLHIIGGDVPTAEPGRILGHEAVATVEEVGASVRSLRPGTRVLVSCVTACATCLYCRHGSYSQCLGGGGWILGHRVHGTQAEYVRVPFAETSTYVIPDGVNDEAVLMLADIFPTSYEVGVRNGAIQPGSTVVVVGAGPIGLAAIATARLYTPRRVIATDIVDSRLEAARRVGADETVTSAGHRPSELVREITDGLGADCAIEAVGLPESFELCTQLVRPCGHVANIGVHGRPATLHLEELWNRNVTLTTGLVDTWSTPVLLTLLDGNELATEPIITHRFALEDMLDAYDTFTRAHDTGALKVVLTRS